MTSYSYLIVGGGMTAAAAIRGIREADKSGTICLVSADPHPPYNRPPLSKGLWKGEALETIWSDIDDLNVTLQLSRSVTRLDPRNRQVTDEQGNTYSYDKLLLATGAAPRRLPFGGNDIIYFRSLDDYQRLRNLTALGRRFAVIGSGFIGSEIAAVLSMNGCEVTVAFPDPQIGSRLYPPDLAEFVTEMYRDKGVEIVAEAQAHGLEHRKGKLVLKTTNEKDRSDREIEVDGVVAGVGVQPSVDLARAAGLEVDDGIRVDSSLRTSQLDIYAAGDVASFHNPALDKWMRVEHEDNANTMGKAAGASMAGTTISYDHLPFFYSDLFDMGYEAVGEVDTRLEMVTDWKDPCKEGVVYYLREGRVRGVLLWNMFGHVDAARKLIASAGPYHSADLKGRLPE